MTAHTAHLLPLGSHPVGCSAVPRAPTLQPDVPRRSPLKAKLAVSLAVGAAPVCALTRGLPSRLVSPMPRGPALCVLVTQGILRSPVRQSEPAWLAQLDKPAICVVRT